MKITKPKFLASERALCTQLQKQLAGRRFVLLTDENVSEHCLPRFGEFLQNNQPLDIIEVEAGEGSKSPEVCIQLWNHFIELGLKKSDVLVCVGGGSISDLGGFVASTFKRGMSFLFIPTTLLSMTDAAIGGKNGVDSMDVKNVIGTFAQPEAIFIHPAFCETLQEIQYLSGFAEVIKHAVISGGALWNEVKAANPKKEPMSMAALKLSVEVKYSIVKKDPFEANVRRVLNFGHTVGHAIESACLGMGSPIEHGLAVAAGMLVETELAIQLERGNRAEQEILMEFIRMSYGEGWPQMPRWSQIVAFLEHDKKVKSKKNVFALPFFIGSVEIMEEISVSQIERAYNQVFN